VRQGYRIWRFDDMDTWLMDEATTEHDDQLRELVDSLEPFQRHMVERVAFGGANQAEAAREVGRTQPEGARAYSKALGVLYEKLQKEDGVGQVPAADDD